MGQGDYPCSDDTDCATTVIPGSQCVADPEAPTDGYCGYAGAICSSDADCDFGSCGSDGTCKGYLGDPCTGMNDCLGYFQCGTDNTCGGPGALAVYQGGSCTSDAATADGTDSSGAAVYYCDAPPADGMEIGSACGNDSVCSSGYCDLTTFTCAARLTASARARKSKRQTQQQFHAVGPSSVKKTCQNGFTACPVVSKARLGNRVGFECVDTDSAIESCGGCAGSGGGVDCTSLPGVDGVSCSVGQCKIQSCMPGSVLSKDGRSCI